MKSFLLVLTIGALLSFAACAGGGTGIIHPTPANYTISDECHRPQFGCDRRFAG